MTVRLGRLAMVTHAGLPEEFYSQASCFIFAKNCNPSVSLLIDGDESEWDFFSHMAVLDSDDEVEPAIVYYELVLTPKGVKKHSLLIVARMFDEERIEFEQRVFISTFAAGTHHYVIHSAMTALNVSPASV